MATKEVKMVSLGDFLTEEQTRRCWGLYPNREQIRDKIVKPNLASINEKLGQENDADYLSYAIVHVIGQGRDQAKGEGATPGSRAGFRGGAPVRSGAKLRSSRTAGAAGSGGA